MSVQWGQRVIKSSRDKLDGMDTMTIIEHDR